MKLFGFIIRIVLLIALVIWLADRPGTAQIVWRDYVIETSAAVLAVIIAALCYIVLLLHKIWKVIVDGPVLWKLRRRVRHHEEGNLEVLRGLSAIASGDAARAGQHAVKARKMLGETGTVRLLLAQSAQIAGDKAVSKTLFESMLPDPEMAVLGYRGLIVAALKEGRHDEAMGLVRQLETTNHHVPWLNLVKFELATLDDNWSQASHYLAKARREKLLPPRDAARIEAAVLLADARASLRDGSSDKAISLAEQALKLSPDWMPVYLMLAESQISGKHLRAAFRTIERGWRVSPHPQLISLLEWSMQGENAIAFFKRALSLTRTAPDHPVSLMALGEAALKADLWGEARRYLLRLVDGGHATVAVYNLLSRLELKECRDEKASNMWLLKGLKAEASPQWLCTTCGSAQEKWDARCCFCGAFNALEWRVPGAGQCHATPTQNVLMQGLLS